MKKVISSLLVAAMAFCANTAKADNISMEEARTASAYFMGYYTGVESLTEKSLTLVYQIDNEKLGIPAAYFFNIADSGWIVMAGTTTIDPIIAYSIDGTFDLDKVPANMMWWLNGYADMVSEIQELDAVNDYPDHQMWTELKTKSYKGDTKERQITLMRSAWGQGLTDGTTYDRFCPQDTNGRHAVTGCVATAIAQIMRYYQFPQKATGTARYWLRNAFASNDPQRLAMPNILMKVEFDTMEPFNYDMMPLVPYDEHNNWTCSDEETKEIARLSYYAGVSVQMAYHPDGSGTQSNYVPGAMSQYFKYEQGTLVARRNNADRDFVNGIRNMLLNGDVVYMSGSSSTGEGADAAGHAWVCCGYMETDTNRYRMNWGWDGGGNTFFNLGINNMPISGYGYNFNLGQRYIRGMVPSNLERIAEVVDGTELGTPYPSPATYSVTLTYDTPNASDLMVYNVEGKLMATYHVQAGVGELTVDVEDYPAGVYIYRMNSRSGRFIVQ